MLMIGAIIGVPNLINSYAVSICRRSGLIAAEHFQIPATLAFLTVVAAGAIYFLVRPKRPTKVRRTGGILLSVLVLALCTVDAMGSFYQTGPGQVWLFRNHLGWFDYRWGAAFGVSLIALFFLVFVSFADHPVQPFNEYAERGY
jgi:hypothetical protein